jgi:hypothetical protein
MTYVIMKAFLSTNLYIIPQIALFYESFECYKRMKYTSRYIDSLILQFQVSRIFISEYYEVPHIFRLFIF